MAMDDWEYQMQYEYRLPNWRDNLFLLFGTHKIVRMLSPSLRNVPLNGIEWSFIQRLRGYDEYAVKIPQRMAYR